MNISINDLSFQYKMYSQTEALERFLDFIRICHEIESGKMKKIDKLCGSDAIDAQFEIAPGCSIYRLLQRVLPPEERGYLLSILVNRAPAGHRTEQPFVFDGKESWACAAAKQNAVVSVVSNSLFSTAVLQGKVGQDEVFLRNIGTAEHMIEHREFLGLRIYRANQEKHKKKRWNPYGRGKVASPMDLDDEEAQRLLERAIEFKGKLYGRYRGRNYAFQNEQDTYYHGYIDEELGDDVKAELDLYSWD